MGVNISNCVLYWVEDRILNKILNVIWKKYEIEKNVYIFNVLFYVLIEKWVWIIIISKVNV